jgi:hypothetical protein
LSAAAFAGYVPIIPATAAELKAASDHKNRIREGNARVSNKRSTSQESWVNRLGYHSVVSNYTGGNTINRLSGSSINRAARERTKMELLSNGGGKLQAVEFIKKSSNKSPVPAWVMPGLLSPDQVKQIRDGKRVSGSSERNVQPVHFLSQRSKGIVRARCAAFYRAAGGRKTFCTLGFINDVTDADGVRVLNKFLTALRDQFRGLEYIWIAERQMKTTGRIHFHLIINKFLPVVKFNALWVLQQYNAGITHEKLTLHEVHKYAQRGELQKHLSPMDVRKVRNVRQLSQYLTKYITKGNNKDGFGCAAWHCSREVSKLFLRTIVSWEVVELAKSDENARFNPGTGEYYGPPTYTAGRQGKGGGFLYMVYHLNQPQRFLCYLREMEQLNKWIIDRTASAQMVMEYLDGVPLPDNLICLN